MNDIFLSYSRVDLAIMQRVRVYLTGAGLKVWTDENLEPGTPAWEKEISQAIQSVRCLVVLLSPHSCQSEWVAREIAFAETHQKRIYPVLIQGTERDAIPFRLINHQYINAGINLNNALIVLAETLSKYLKTAVVASPTTLKKGFYYPNKFARAYLMALENALTRSVLEKVLIEAVQTALIDNYPPDNLEKQFSFADFTAVSVALHKVMGKEQAPELEILAGRDVFADGMSQIGALTSVNDPAFKPLPLIAKLIIGVPMLANVLAQVSDQISNVYTEANYYKFTMERCAMCWGRHADEPVCYMTLGVLKEGLKYISDGKEFRVEMSACIARGDDMGQYVIYKEPIS